MKKPSSKTKKDEALISLERTSQPTRILQILRVLFKMHPWRATLVVSLLAASGLSEGIGILSLLPLIAIASEGAAPLNDSAGTIVGDMLGLIGVRPTLGPLLTVIVVGVMLKAGLFLAAMRQAGVAAADTAAELRLELFEALMTARWSYFTSQPVGSLTNAAGSEAIRASHLYTQAAYMAAGAVHVIVYVVLAMLVSWYVTVVALVLVLVLAVLLNSLVRKARAAGRRETELMTSMIGRLSEGLSAIKPLKAMAREESLQPVLDAETHDLNRAQRQQAVTKAAMSTFHEPVISLLLAVAIYILLGRFTIGFGQLAFMALVAHRIVTRMGNFQTYYLAVMSLESAFSSIREAIDRAKRAAEVTSGVEPPTLQRAIELRDVTFSFGSKVIFEKLSFSFPAKKLTAVTGPSGLGKTTLSDLVMGLLTPDSGEVVIDGVPLSKINLRLWRSRIGYVPQEVLLLHTSVLDNVAMGAPGIGSDQVEEALRAAEAWDFVTALPEGLQTAVGERGIRLSGGQRQRIAIARALVRRPELLVLDEATTGLDPATEEGICRTLRSLSGRMTILSISHQTALAAIADKVFHLDELGVTSPVGTSDKKAEAG